jgi:hypothetical protein
MIVQAVYQPVKPEVSMKITLNLSEEYRFLHRKALQSEKPGVCVNALEL